jgi:calcineurin-like phosphoesterase family protein
MIEEWIDQCHRLIMPEDTLIFLGDLGITLADLDVYARLPACQRVLVFGDKEYANKHFSLADFLARNRELQVFGTCRANTVWKIAGRDYYLSHKPLDCLDQELPALCGHIHGIWRSAQMPNGQPIINVGIDAWGGLVSEEFVDHQYTAISRHYDANAFPAKWQ